MTTAHGELRCPFCHTVLAPHVAECHRCHARRQSRKGMTLKGFRLFVATWLALSLPVMAVACWVGFAPWAPSRDAPGYALAMVGAKPTSGEVVRCRVEVAGADGSRQAQVVDGACGAGSAAAPAAATAAPSLTERRLATALHSLLCLLAGLAACGALLPIVRQCFRTRTDPSWVQRTA